MKQEKFIVYFAGGSETVYALNQEQAKILAQAKRINKGMDFRVYRIELVSK